MKDISTSDDIKLIVDSFYQKVRENELLSPVFNSVIQNRWPEHLEKMYCFWQTVLLHDHTYFGNPFVPHAKLPVEGQHFNEWLKLWHNTVDSFFFGEKANEAKWRGDKMATMFLSKIEYYKNNPAIPLI